MDPYRTSGTIDEAVIKETIGIFIPTWYRRLTGTLCAVSLLFVLIFAFEAKKFLFAAFFLLFAALFASYPALLRRRFFKITTVRMREQAGTLSLPFESFFTVDGLSVHNLKADASAVLRYEDIAFALKSKRCFAVMTRGQQFSVIFKEHLTDEQQKNFLPDLKRRCPNLQIRR